MEAILNRLNRKTNFETMGKITGAQKIFAQVCEKHGLPRPTQEFKFHPTRKWRIDYFFNNPLNGVKVALEVEGGVFGYGRHNRIGGYLKDLEKYNALAENGILLVRVIPQNLCTFKNLETLKNALKIDNEKRTTK